jgi:hypothetical protein
MKTKEDIVANWLPRYTGEKLENFGSHILLTNFSNYLALFAEWNGATVVKAPPTTIFRPKCPPCRHLRCKKPFLPVYGNMAAITGPVPATALTAGFGNTTLNLRIT